MTIEQIFLSTAVILLGFVILGIHYYCVNRELKQVLFIVREGYKIDALYNAIWVKDEFRGPLNKAYRRAVLMKERRDLKVPSSDVTTYQLGGFAE